MYGSNPFTLPLSQGVLKTLGAESIRVFEQQGQQGGQGSQGHGPCEDNTPSQSDLDEVYSDSENEFYLFVLRNGWSDEVQVIKWTGSTPTQSQKTKYLQWARYSSRKMSDRGLGGGCVPQMENNYSRPAPITQLFPISGLWGDYTAQDPSTGRRLYQQAWEQAKAAHLAQFGGCTESTAMNYTPNAAQDDGTCVWNWEEQEQSNWNWTSPQTSKTSDGWRYKWEMAQVELKSGYTQADKRVRGTWRIYKECEDKWRCGEPSTEQDISARTLPNITLQTGQIGYQNGMEWDDFVDAVNDAKAAGQTAINTLFTNHVAVECRDGAPYETDLGSTHQPCDDSFTLNVRRAITFCANGTEWKRATYSLEKDGVVQQSWVVLNDENYSLSLDTGGSESAAWQQHMGPKGMFAWFQAAQDIADAYDATLETTTTTQEYAINDGSSRPMILTTGVVDYEQRIFILPWGRKTIITNPTCGGGRIDNAKAYRSIYPYTAKEGVGSLLGFYPKPSVGEVTDANGNKTLVVKIEGETLTPSATWEVTGLTADEKDALLEPYLAKIGCMDSTATNYDPDANMNAKQSASNSKACWWKDCKDGSSENDLDSNCKTCLPDADGEERKMFFDTTTNTWSCVDITADTDTDPAPTSEVVETTGEFPEWVPLAALGGIILMLFGLGG